MSGPSTSSSGPTIGVEPGRPRIGAGGGRDLSSGVEVLPEIVETPAKQRPWWLHPAFVVSILLTVLALGAALAWAIVSAMTDSSVTVSHLRISSEGGNVALAWDGPDAAYALYQVSGDRETTDLTQLVRGTSAWVFSAADLYDESSCFIVRPAAADGPVSLDAATLQSQNGASVCVSDAR
ncbi:MULTISPECIES: hypothetical protein [unclassified Microbacterium]|uniref:hypothetical protein n=1 Tax=unclassified Microbacterium TaxID=2609290 RepID=UPI00301A9BC7